MSYIIGTSRFTLAALLKVAHSDYACTESSIDFRALDMDTYGKMGVGFERGFHPTSSNSLLPAAAEREREREEELARKTTRTSNDGTDDRARLRMSYAALQSSRNVHSTEGIVNRARRAFHGCSNRQREQFARDIDSSHAPAL